MRSLWFKGCYVQAILRDEKTDTIRPATCRPFAVGQDIGLSVGARKPFATAVVTAFELIAWAELPLRRQAEVLLCYPPAKRKELIDAAAAGTLRIVRIGFRRVSGASGVGGKSHCRIQAEGLSEPAATGRVPAGSASLDGSLLHGSRSTPAPLPETGNPMPPSPNLGSVGPPASGPAESRSPFVRVMVRRAARDDTNASSLAALLHMPPSTFSGAIRECDVGSDRSPRFDALVLIRRRLPPDLLAEFLAELTAGTVFGIHRTDVADEVSGLVGQLIDAAAARLRQP